MDRETVFLAGKTSDLYDELWVGVGEALEFILVEVHNEELVCGCQLHHHLGELFVKVANITAGLLNKEKTQKGKSMCYI